MTTATLTIINFLGDMIPPSKWVLNCFYLMINQGPHTPMCALVVHRGCIPLVESLGVVTPPVRRRGDQPESALILLQSNQPPVEVP